MMADKPMPWHDDGDTYQNLKANTERALGKAARRTRSVAPGGLNEAERAYVDKAFNEEISELERTTTGGRNHQLNIAAFALGQFVAAGALDERTVRDALVSACRVNGHLQDDGMSMVEGTIQSGLDSGMKEPRDMSQVGKGERKSYQRNGLTLITEDEAPQNVSLDGIYDIEQGFWTSRESLQNIYLAALARMCAPWAVLGFVAARVLTLVPPHITLPPVVGGVGSLNYFCAVAAPSGGGKGSAGAVAKEMVNELVLERNPGSGEGMIDAYVKPANKELGEPRGLHEAVMFVADEIDNIAALNSRSGNTMSAMLRSGFSGETLGFSYRNSSNLHLAAHTYRMTLVVSAQPARAGALIDDIYGGTLQRFQWFPGIDQRVSVDRPLMPAPLELPRFSVWQYPTELTLPTRATELILKVRAARARGEAYSGESHLAGHALYIREKFAYALAVIDGRHAITEEDWLLAGVASKVSDLTRDWVISEAEVAVKSEAAKRGELMGVTSHAADVEKMVATQARLNRIAKWVGNKLNNAGQQGLSKRELSQSVGGRDRPSLDMVLEELARKGVIVRDKATGKWTKCSV